MKNFQEQYCGTLLENIFEEARPHGNQNIGISSQKLHLRLWLLVTQQKIAVNYDFPERLLPIGMDSKRRTLQKKSGDGPVGQHKCVEFLKSKISTNPNPCKHCVQMKNATMLFCMMVNTAKQWNYSTVKNSQKIPKPWYYVFGLNGTGFHST